MEVIIALLNMLASLARDPLCAHEAFIFLATDASQYHPGHLQALGAFSGSTLSNTLYKTSDNLSRIQTTPIQSTSPTSRRRPSPASFPSSTPQRLLFLLPGPSFNITVFPIAQELNAS